MEYPTSENTLSDSSDQVMKHSEVSSESSSKDGSVDHETNKLEIQVGIFRSTLFYIKISLWFFGNSVVSGATTAFTIPFQVAMLRAMFNDKEYWNGVVPVAGMFINLISTPIFGYLSDNTRTPFGKRRPYILIGTVIMLMFLALAATFDSPQDSMPGFIIVLTGLQFGQGIAGGAFSGIIPDMVHATQAGIASGWLGVAFSIGLLIGTLLSGNLLYVDGVVRTWWLYGAAMAFLGVSTVVSLIFMNEDTYDDWSMDGTVKGFVMSLYLPCSTYFNFYWVLITRFFNTMGIYMIFAFLYYFAQDVIGVTDLKISTIIVIVLVVFSVPASIAGGYLADYYNTKLLVYISSIVQVIAISLLIILCFMPSLAGLLVLAGVLGVGYGAYQCVDWALALHSLPNKTIGKDMGIWHISFIAPTVIAPAITGSILNSTKASLGAPIGYSIVFTISTMWFILATIFIFPMKISATSNLRRRKAALNASNNSNNSIVDNENKLKDRSAEVRESA
ncbi:hypothetical protein CYY_008208 [Polysphondylium violaceum]|uniref:Major facilitator superfamily (MFS) profile domain-containing protein n=1 Tax=Polysphondylium violaceum TaxID=133409 RepID=A0A8J4PM01_9MYCE|nr:hypothetical protein CYY_008208 [Polysphondylium violaceum]